MAAALDVGLKQVICVQPRGKLANPDIAVTAKFSLENNVMTAMPKQPVVLKIV
jgi:hypothetical protein